MAHTTLISTDVLGEHLDERWAIVDCRYDLSNEGWGLEQYLAAHVPGAVYASLSHDLAGAKTGSNGRHPIPSHEAMAATFGRLGIGPGTQVVVYDQDTGMFASRLWWMLRYMGHDAVAVLDGGWAKWIREGRPVRSGDESRVTPPGTDERRAEATFSGRPREQLRTTVGDVQHRLGDPSLLLVDARGRERFEGTSEPLDRVPGHIPGAVNHYYKQNLAADGTMLPAEALRKQFEDLLAGRPPDQAVMYCGSGVSACHNLLAMEHVGLRGTKLYPGSWSEWSADPARPVETGAAVKTRN